MQLSSAKIYLPATATKAIYLLAWYIRLYLLGWCKTNPMVALVLIAAALQLLCV